MFLVEGFKLGAEFVFDASLASAEIGGIQSQIEGLSGAVDNLTASTKSMGLQFGLQLTGLGGGLVGVLGQAISSSDDFTKAQLAFSNIIASNMEHFTGSVDTFTDRMGAARNTVKDIIADARQFAIPAKDLLRTTEIIGALTASQGLTGNNFKISRDLSTNYLKLSRSMGIDPSQSMNQFANMITGDASEQGLFGTRVFKELQVKDPMGNVVKSAKEWNKFFEQDKIRALVSLNSAMDAFTKNANELEGTTSLIGVSIKRIKDLFFGFSSILRPLGDVLLPVVQNLFKIAISFIENQGARMVQTMATFLGALIEDPKKFMVNLLQVRRLAGDVGKAAFWAGTALGLLHLNDAIMAIGRTAIGGQIGRFISGIPLLSTISKWLTNIIGKFSVFMGVGKGFFAIISKVSLLFGGLLIIFQSFSRALAKADILKTIDMFLVSDSFVAAVSRVSAALIEILRPIDILIEGLSELFLIFMPTTSGLGFFTWALEGLASVLEVVSSFVKKLTGVMMALAAGIVGVVDPVIEAIAGIMDMGPIDYIKSLIGGTSSIDEGNGPIDLAMKMIAAYQKYSQPFLKEGEEGGDKVAKNITNIGKVEINNNIRQNIQPDRLAFTIKEQLMKTAKNPTAARNNGGFAGAFAQ